MKVFVDTSALLALLDEDDRHHRESAVTFRALLATAELVTHNYVEVETLALARRRLGPGAVARLTDDVLPALAISWVDEPLHRAALAAHRTGGSASLVDRVSFALMRREGITVAFAFDADFEAEGFLRPAPQAGRGEGPRLAETSAAYDTAVPMAADLVGVTEIAGRAGRSVNTVQSWRRRHGDFPAPVAALATGPVWTWPDVARWIGDRGARERSGVIARR